MRTLFQLNVTANWGSTGKIAEGIGQAAINQGWESFIAYGRDMNPSESRLIKVGNQFDVYAHYARHRLFDGEGLGSKGSTKNLIKKIEQIAPDIIHLHNIHDHWLNYPILFDYFAAIDTPIVWTFHDCWAFTGGCAYFEIPKCKKWQNQCKQCLLNTNCTDKSNRNHLLKTKLVNRIADKLTIVSVSQWLNDLVSQSKLNPHRQEVIYNGVDVEQLLPYNNWGAKIDFEDKKIVLGVANVWSHAKGIDSFIELREKLNEDFLIVLVGLDRKIIKGLPNGIIGLPRTQSIKELAQLYSRADVHVSLSIQETFGMTLAESLSCGTPVIAFDVTALPEVISSDTGVLVEKNDLKGVAKAITKICTSERFSREVCRQRAETNFNKTIQFRKYVDLYESLRKK